MATKAKRKDAWKIPGLSARVHELIREGFLLKKNGVTEIYGAISKEFAEQLAGNSYRLDMRQFARRVREHLWTHKVLEDLRKAVRHNVPIERFHKDFYPYIPSKLLKDKVKSLTGRTNASITTKFVAGVGRLSMEDLPAGAEGFEFPKITPQEPFVLPGGANARIALINGALIGLKYDRNIADNPVRRALIGARLRGADAVILTNTIDMNTKKTVWTNKVYRAAVSGIRINPARFPRYYREEVKRVLRDQPPGELIFQTIAEKFGEVMDGWQKIATRPDGAPEFPGPIYVAFGYREEEIIAEAAQSECRYLTIQKQGRVEAELSMAKGQLAAAMKHRRGLAATNKWELEVKRLSEMRARIILTNVADRLVELTRLRLRAMVVGMFEKAIPNCKVISQGNVYLKLHDKSIKLHVPSRDAVSDELLADFGDKYGSEVFNDTLADLTIICHPYALNHRLVGREDSKDGMPVTKFVHVAPICVDDVFLTDSLRDSTRKMHPISKAIFNPQFKPGALFISLSNGILSVDSLPIKSLSKVEAVLGTNFAFPYPKTKYYNVYVNTDNHFGGSAKRFIWDPKQRMHLGVNEAAIELMRRGGLFTASDMPVHMVAELDDATDGNLWFNPTYRPDPEVMPLIRIEAWLQGITADIQRAAERGDMGAVLRLTEEVNRISISQHHLRGDHFPFHQMMQVYDRHIDPNVDFYSAVLRRFEKSRLTIRGVSEINKKISDTRDVGVLNFPNGNHRIHTLDGADLEGEYPARHLRARLLASPLWRGKEAFLEKAVCAPRFGSETFGLGTIKAPGRYEWGLRFLGSPPKLSSWSDLLAAFVKSDYVRGDDTYGLMKFFVVTIVGDKHFYCLVETSKGVYAICAAGVHTDLYGSTGGFPPNNTGVCFVSFPADGPDAGPILMRMLPHDYLRDWFAKPRHFDWNKFLPEPI
ncbi:MAG: hypothetical protein LiPW15_250 [Parcubacteria group bacterium LiPW_15]|nr:MAG: hypothetical protein LiPW15_250 [Parcubacteria group bacterium LiPW_15]